MKRGDFLQWMGLLPLMGFAMPLSTLGSWVREQKATARMPVLFLGHGSPMNAIEENEFVRGFRNIATTIPRPKAILCISAHWETKGTLVTAMQHPRTIHDFGGFPRKLFEVQYPAPGSPALASEVIAMLQKSEAKADHHWGLDHGAWSVIKHLYPDADIPVLQLSLDKSQGPLYHFELAKQLSGLRDKGILLIGSGNIVHNLGLVAWDKLNQVGFAYDWAREAHAIINKHILDGDFMPLTRYEKLGKSVQLAVPSPDHFLPLLYTLALKDTKDKIELFNDKALAGSLTMTSLKIA